ncbi:cytochrome P450 3A24-like isoform X2 [Littorina saxatilis]
MEIFYGLCEVPAWWMVVLIIVVSLYTYGIWSHSTWPKLGIPGPRPEPFFGNTRQLRKKTFYVAYAEWHKQYGRVFGLDFMGSPMLVVTDLDILREIMVKDFNNFADRHFMAGTTRPPTIDKGLFFAGGTAWKRIRNLMTPTFTASKLKNMCPVIDRCSHNLVDNLQTKGRDGQSVDIKSVFSSFTMDVIAGTAFGVETNSQTQDNDPFVTNCRALLTKLAQASKLQMFATLFPVITPLLRAFNLTTFSDPEADFLVNSVYTMVDDRKKSTEGKKRTDLLQLLVDVEHNASGGTANQMTREEIVGQGFIVLIAGFDTTANTLHYLVYNLALHQHVQQQLFQEIVDNLGDADPTYDNVATLKYLDCVVHETLRLFPPLPLINRRAKERRIIKGVTIPAGCGVGIPIYHILRDPEYFEDPETFNPVRFSGENRAKLDPLTVELPFGYGPRQCIGMRLALLEIKFAVVRVCRRFQFLKCEHTPDKVDFTAASLATPRKPIKLLVQPRKAT